MYEYIHLFEHKQRSGIPFRFGQIICGDNVVGSSGRRARLCDAAHRVVDGLDVIARLLRRVSVWRALENAAAGRGRYEHLPRPHADQGVCQAEEGGGHIRVRWAGPTVSLTTLTCRHALSSVETMPRNLVCVRV